jgi:hypothetical protein
MDTVSRPTERLSPRVEGASAQLVESTYGVLDALNTTAFLDRQSPAQNADEGTRRQHWLTSTFAAGALAVCPSESA